MIYTKKRLVEKPFGRFFIRQRVELLNESNAFELAKLLIEESKIIDRNKVIFPVKVTDEDVKVAEEDLRSMRAYGIFDNGRLVSVCLLEELLSYIPEVYWIQDVITSRNYRGMGFATSVVSKAVEDAFKHDSVRYVGLRVRSDNIPAKRLYEKIGFKKHRDRRWLSLNVEGNP